MNDNMKRIIQDALFTAPFYSLNAFKTKSRLQSVYAKYEILHRLLISFTFVLLLSSLWYSFSFSSYSSHFLIWYPDATRSLGLRPPSNLFYNWITVKWKCPTQLFSFFLWRKTKIKLHVELSLSFFTTLQIWKLSSRPFWNVLSISNACTHTNISYDLGWKNIFVFSC